uniref:Olfactory receptor n=1 Tax=Leptobrachium leishanense TaxID=445787 RepID=A0A8C5PV92_9ANUR
MENQTSIKVFHIIPFAKSTGKNPFLFLTLFLYLFGLLVNLIIVTLICVDPRLRTPLYCFLWNLSFVDICYMTVSLPKLMDILISKNSSVSLVQCLTQMFFFTFMASTEIILLSSMAYDRYVAICNPLHYPLIMSKARFVFILVFSWTLGFINAFVLTWLIPVSWCHSNTIHHFYCELKALLNISCVDVVFQIVIYVDILLFGCFPFLLSLTSYLKILRVVLKIKTTYGRSKAFSTCSSHLTVLLLFYGTGVIVYMRPIAQHSHLSEQMLSLLYIAVTPALNPLIYSVRNKEVKHALMRISGNRKS